MENLNDEAREFLAEDISEEIIKAYMVYTDVFEHDIYASDICQKKFVKIMGDIIKKKFQAN